MRRGLGQLLLAAGTALAAACGAAPAGDAPAASMEARAGTPAFADSAEGGPGLADSGGSVRLGIDVLLAANADILRGRRVGLITNHTGRNAAGESTIDLLHEHPAVDLVALFSPEHGIRGTAEAGERVESGRDARTGLPVHSLYGETRTPTAAMLEGIDVLVFDIQDIGSRYYTYVWTMALAMRAAAEHGIPFVVLDRPNPIGGALVQGNVLDPGHTSFVGLYPVPMRHGLTAGELARLVNAEFEVGADLTVVPMEGWRRDMWYDETGLPWTPPSPNMPSLESATHYPGTCLFEGTNLSVGRGTPLAFQQIGAPWLDHEELARRLEAYHLPGVRFDVVAFTPERPGDGKYDGVAVRGVRFVATDRDRYDPTRAAVAALIEIRRLHPDRLEWRSSHFDRLAGTDRLRRQIVDGASLEDVTRDWEGQVGAFNRLRERYLLYR